MKNDWRRANLWPATMPMLTAAAALIALAAASLHALSGIRAYVGGEGLWSKAQEDATYYRVRYARTAEAGFEWHLTKPIDAMQLQAILSKIQEKRA